MSSAKWGPFCSGPNVWTHCGIAMPYIYKYLVNVGSGNGFLPDDAKSLSETLLTSHLWGLLAISQKMLRNVYIYIFQWYEFEKNHFILQSVRGQWVNINVFLLLLCAGSCCHKSIIFFLIDCFIVPTCATWCSAVQALGQKQTLHKQSSQISIYRYLQFEANFHTPLTVWLPPN